MTTKVRTIEEIVSELGETYKGWKDNESKKDDLRNEFFEAISRNVDTDALAERVVEVRASSKEAAIRLVHQRHPTWTIPDEEEGIRENPDNNWEVIIREDPDFVSFFINLDGKIFERQVVMGSPMIDDERLKAENPDLYCQVTQWPHEDFLTDLLYNSGVDGHALDGTYNEDDPDNHTPYLNLDWVVALANQYGVERQLKPLDALEPRLLDQLQEYTYRDKPKVKLPAPRMKVDG